jgi:hypothetical protein
MADLWQAYPERLANPAAGSIAIDGTAKCARHGKAHARSLSRRAFHREAESGEQRSRVAKSILVYGFEVG